MKMNRIALVVLTTLLLCTAAPLSAASILPKSGSTWSGTPPTLGTSQDGNPPGTMVDILAGQVDEWLVDGSSVGMFTFSAGTYDITLLDEIAGFSNVNRLSWAPVSNLLDLTLIFDGPDSPVQTKMIAPLVEWAFVLESGNGQSYTSLEGRALAARDSGNPGVVFVGFEDKIDEDNNDIIFSVEGQTAAVPEPSTYLTFLAGIAGLAWFKRKRT